MTDIVIKLANLREDAINNAYWIAIDNYSKSDFNYNIKIGDILSIEKVYANDERTQIYLDMRNLDTEDFYEEIAYDDLGFMMVDNLAEAEGIADDLFHEECMRQHKNNELKLRDDRDFAQSLTEDEDSLNCKYKIGSYVEFNTGSCEILGRVRTNSIEILNEDWNTLFEELDIYRDDNGNYRVNGMEIRKCGSGDGFYLNATYNQLAMDSVIDYLLAQCAVEEFENEHVESNEVVNKVPTAKEMLYSSTDLDNLTVRKLTIY
tara:strand:- start:4881 stop:5666 length:786 start_codon:yes stop_codon:yes gene_type:complete